MVFRDGTGVSGIVCVNEARGPDVEAMAPGFVLGLGLCSKRLIRAVSAAAGSGLEPTVCDSAMHRCHPLHQPCEAASRLAASSSLQQVSPLQATGSVCTCSLRNPLTSVETLVRA